MPFDAVLLLLRNQRPKAAEQDRTDRQRRHGDRRDRQRIDSRSNFHETDLLPVSTRANDMDGRPLKTADHPGDLNNGPGLSPSFTFCVSCKRRFKPLSGRNTLPSVCRCKIGGFRHAPDSARQIVVHVDRLLQDHWSRRENPIRFPFAEMTPCRR